jgi:antitoxin CptB
VEAANDPDITRDHRLRRLRFRAWHRGTREADLMIGGFADRGSEGWDEAELRWFEALLDEQDVDVMGWAFGTIAAPDAFHGPMLDALRKLDYVAVAMR